MLDAGAVVITAFISPFRSERDMARELFEPGEFIEVFLDVPLAVVEQRDPKTCTKRSVAASCRTLPALIPPTNHPRQLS